MPVEIREIVIRTTLETAAPSRRAAADAIPQALREELREELLDACARLVREAHHSQRRER